jgi:hypothetical protein
MKDDEDEDGWDDEGGGGDAADIEQYISVMESSMTIFHLTLKRSPDYWGTRKRCIWIMKIGEQIFRSCRRNQEERKQTDLTETDNTDGVATHHKYSTSRRLLRKL